MLLIGLMAAAVALGLLTFTFLGQADERAAMRSSLRALDGYEVENVRDQELLNPLKERAFGPMMRALTAAGRRYTKAGYVESVRRKLLSVGEASPDAVDRFLAKRVLGILGVPVSFAAVFFLLPIEGRLRWALFGLLALLLVLGPTATLNRKVEERQKKIRMALPDVLDLLVISVEAGLGFEQALDRTVDAVPGPLSDELTRMLGEVRAGSSRADAMRAMDARIDVSEMRSFVLAILQADTFGVSIGRVLRAQAEEMRIKRRQMAQERAMKAPVKMLIPMVFCIFPALFVVTLGPAILNILENFKGAGV